MLIGGRLQLSLLGTGSTPGTPSPQVQDQLYAPQEPGEMGIISPVLLTKKLELLEPLSSTSKVNSGKASSF